MSWFGHYDRKPGFFLSFCYQLLQAGNIPQHVAFIMDGNRRFAKKEGISRKDGHSKGFMKLTEVLQWCYELSISEVTVYAFSTENFKRSEEEVHSLLSIFRDKLKQLLEEKDSLTKYGVCIRFIGDNTLFDEDMRQLISEVVSMTKDNKQSFLNIAVAYTSREEMTQAVKEVSIGVKHGLLHESDIDEELLEKCFYTNKSKPVDLLIRTSGEIRLSDFLLWQTSFSILCFIEALWPDLTVWNFLYCILKYQLAHTTLENAKDLSKLKEERVHLDNDLRAAYLSASSSSSSVNKDLLERLVRKRVEQRERRIKRFLLSMEDRRYKRLHQLIK